MSINEIEQSLMKTAYLNPNVMKATPANQIAQMPNKQMLYWYYKWWK